MRAWTRIAAIALALSGIFWTSAVAETEGTKPAELRVLRFVDSTHVELTDGSGKSIVTKGGSFGDWTLMEITGGPSGEGVRCAVLEDFAKKDGAIVFVTIRGEELRLKKSLEPTFGDEKKFYLGHSLDDVKNSAQDLLGNEILSTPGDPSYEEIAAVFPPIRNFKTYTFAGTPETIDKVGFQYGGRTPNFDPAPYFPAINKIRDDGKVWDGLVGGYLPVLRFVYSEAGDNWTEMVAFAPLRISNGNNRIQPVWYRVCRVEGGKLKWAKYIDSYHPFPPRTEYDARIFYTDLKDIKVGWDGILKDAMKIEIPDERMQNMARYSLARAIMTRVGNSPKYGAFDKDYAGSEHDGFPDTFTVETAAMLDWGMVDRAGRYIDNYFGEFVRDDGSILYRGPETGQYGRMLTVVAQYVNLGGNPELLLNRRSRIDGVTKLLLHLREKAQKLPASDPAYGMIAGWSEADACLDPDPPRYMQPYFSNNTEAARGFRELGAVWEKIGKQKGNTELAAWGQRLVKESAELERDIQTAISRSILKVDGKNVLPAIAGVQEPFHVVVPKDGTDPQFRSYRAYMEMMYSGVLTKEQIQMIAEYRKSQHDILLGVPTAYGYNTGELAGFLSYGYGYGLIQTDMIREALLLTYSHMAHQYTRGTWTAPETRNVYFDRAAPYCTPAELVAAMMTRWLLVFEEPGKDVIWLGKGAPTKWLEDGKKIRVTSAATKWGKVDFSIASQMQAGKITAQLKFPANGFGAETKLRLRAPGDAKIKSVTVQGKLWAQFDGDTIILAKGMKGMVDVIANY